MEPTTADGSPHMVKSRGRDIPMEWRIFLWPPKRDGSLANIVKQLSDPVLYELHGVSTSMMMSPDECHQAAKRIEEEAFNEYADEPAEVDSGLPVFKAYLSKIKRAIITTVKSRGTPSTGPRDFIPMEETEPKVYHDRDLSDGKESRIANLLASDAVKEYNNRQFEDKLELVKVTKETGIGVSGYLYNLTFDAKVLGDGGGGTTKTYQAKVWLEIDGTQQVISFKLTDDGQGKATITTYIG